MKCSDKNTEKYLVSASCCPIISLGPNEIIVCPTNLSTNDVLPLLNLSPSSTQAVHIHVFWGCGFGGSS